jgi:pyrroline-5-carboxylate reductase
MAEALARGLIAKGVAKASTMCCSDPNQGRMDLFKSIGITPYLTNVEVQICCCALPLSTCV